MKIGLQVPDFTWPGGAATLGADLAAVARTADDAGFEFIGVMDHFLQIGSIGSAKRAMLESYTTLGYLAGHTSRARLLTLVTGAVYRHPGVLAKQVTTLDVLSGGRAWLGIGAAWNEDEARSLGIPFRPSANASKDSRRRSGSVFGCGRRARSRSRAGTTAWSVR